MPARSPDRDVVIAGGNLPTSSGRVFQARCESVDQLQAAAGSWRRVRTRGGMCDLRKQSICEWHAWSIDGPLYVAMQFLSILGTLQQPLVTGQRNWMQVLVEYKPKRCQHPLLNVRLGSQSVDCNAIVIIVGRPRQYIAFEHAVVL